MWTNISLNSSYFTFDFILKRNRGCLFQFKNFLFKPFNLNFILSKSWKYYLKNVFYVQYILLQLVIWFNWFRMNEGTINSKLAVTRSYKVNTCFWMFQKTENLVTVQFYTCVWCLEISASFPKLAVAILVILTMIRSFHFQ